MPTPSGPSCDPCGASILGQTKENGNKLDALNALLNGLSLLDLSEVLKKLNTINSKLGPQIGNENFGISGYLKKFTSWMKFDRVINILIWINTLHNAYMLSSSLTDTLFSIIDNILSLATSVFLKDVDDNSIDTKEIFGGLIDNFAKSLFGVETWNGMKDTWKKWNRIYQAAANIANTVRSMIDSLRSISEFIAENTGKIGNALKRFGAVGEKAFNWMPEQVNARSIWVQRLENLEDAASGLEMVTSELVSVKDNLKELTDQKKEFEKSIEELEPKEQKDNKPLKDKADKATSASTTPSIPAISSDADKEADD